jgi:hypothetical protein
MARPYPSLQGPCGGKLDPGLRRDDTGAVSALRR